MQEQIPVQWKVMGRGRTTKDGIAEAQDELRKWLGAARAAAIATQARGRGRGSTKTTGTVTQETADTQPYAVLDFGQGRDGMKEGASRAMPVFGSDRKRQYKGWKEGYTIPDMLGDFTSTQDNWKSSRMLGRTEAGDCIAAMAIEVLDSFLVNLAVSNSLNTDHERIVDPRNKLAIESIQTEICF